MTLDDNIFIYYDTVEYIDNTLISFQETTASDKIVSTVPAKAQWDDDITRR